ncbi:MAG TPA: hypothetical protein DHU78_03250, partial [Opitutae bacterium]|nr:hypothetical protein [Opitutae bacterium]
MFPSVQNSIAWRLSASFFLLALFDSCSEKRLSSDDVEYRKDDFGNEILYAIDDDEPFGQGKRAYVTEKYDNGQIRFEIGFVNGLKDGKVEFWQTNGLPELTGSYAKGKRDGLFTAYGKIGEIVYSKSFINDKLDGNFTLYYPASNSDKARFFEKLYEVRSEKSYFSWNRLKNLFSSEKVDPEEIKVTNHLRLEAQFHQDFPVGPYRAFFHPGNLQLSQEELLKEDGFFSDLNRSKGQLIEQQRFYYPRASGLVVILPDKVRLD